MRVVSTCIADSGEEQHFRGSLGEYPVELVEEFYPPEHRAALRIVERVTRKSLDASLMVDPNAHNFIYFDEMSNTPEGKTLHPDTSRAAYYLVRLLCPLFICITMPRKGRPVGRMAYIYHRTVEDQHSRRDIEGKETKRIDQATVDYQFKRYTCLLAATPTNEIEAACESAVVAAVDSPQGAAVKLLPADAYRAVCAAHKWMLDAAPAENGAPDSCLVLALHLASQYRIPDGLKEATHDAVRRSGGSQLLEHLLIEVECRHLSVACRLLAAAMWRLQHENVW